MSNDDPAETQLGLWMAAVPLIATLAAPTLPIILKTAVCVQRRLAHSVGVSPTGVKVQAP